MSNKQLTIISIMFIILIGLGLVLIHLEERSTQDITSNELYDAKIIVIKNNSTRDYKFEHYCDSVYEVNPNYYYDVIVETDKFQDYIHEHGEWWTN